MPDRPVSAGSGIFRTGIEETDVLSGINKGNVPPFREEFFGRSLYKPSGNSNIRDRLVEILSYKIRDVSCM